MKIAAITGSIGCGKTTLAGIVRQMGYVVFDVDGWVRRLYYKIDFISVIQANFPNVVEGGKVNKRKLRNIVFNDKIQLKKLESLIHPFLKSNLKSIIRRCNHCDDIFFIDVALLFEMGWDKYCDLVIVADVGYELQKKRVMARDNVSAEDFDKINDVQMKQSEKKEKADIVIDTDQPHNVLRQEMFAIIQGLNQW